MGVSNRLKTSSFTYKYLDASNTMVWDASSKYDENITNYDRNGNIKHLDRYHGTRWRKIEAMICVLASCAAHRCGTSTLPHGPGRHTCASGGKGIY